MKIRTHNEAQATDDKAWDMLRSSAPICCGKKMRCSGRTGIKLISSKKSVGKATFYCPKCTKTEERQHSAKVQAMLDAHDVFMGKEGTEMHSLWHTIVKKLKVPNEPGVWTDNNGWKCKGYELMMEFAKIIKKNPDIMVCGCNDGWHAGSDIVLIPHQTKVAGKIDYYWGTTVIIIPQCSGENPTEIFLYGGHAKDLLAALQKIVSKHKEGKE